LGALNVVVRLAPLFCRSFGPVAMPETSRRHSPGPQRWPFRLLASSADPYSFWLDIP
jgi:hypothetical protein